MFYSVRGELIYTAPNEAVVECGGVGYKCTTTLSTLRKLPPIGSEVLLYTFLNVRENAIDLFGFITIAEHNCFKLLTSVSGVGPKVGIALLSELSPDQVMLSLVTGDVKSLTKAAGVGAKLAQRIILELKDKVKNEDLSKSFAGVTDTMNQASFGGDVGEALSALVVLGYSQSEAAQSIASCPKDMPVAELIKAGLKKLSGGR